MMDDMGDMDGTPWIEAPTVLHEFRGYQCTLNSTEMCEYQQGYWRFWYEDDHRYALPTVAFFLTGIVLFALAFVGSHVLPQQLTQAKPVRKITALGRYLSYRVFRIQALNWNSAPVGILLLGACGTVFFFSMTFGPKPYYWPNTDTVSYGDSPPLATRSGWLSLGCMPFVFATSSKSNFITAVTGVPHEKLQVFHRWIAYAFFVTALFHTFPFIVYHISKGDMVEQWQTSFEYWTGVVALLAQAWLTFASFSPIRNLCYEFFKFSHFLAALVFIIFLFVHCDFTLSSADYFIATGVLFSLSWLHSQLRVFFEHGIGKQAVLSITPNGFIRVVVPTRSTWIIGQHCFIRFLSPSMQPWTSHPFTICSLPERGSFYDAKESQMVFYIRPQGGFTAKLARYVGKRPDASVRVLLDGPYGGVNMQKVAKNQRAVVIAGGSGAGWIIPFVESHLRRLELGKLRRNDNGAAVEALPSLRVILATRDVATRQWFEHALADLFAGSITDEVQKYVSVEVYYTGGAPGSAAPPTHTGRKLLQELDDPEKATEVSVQIDSKSDSELSCKRSESASTSGLAVNEFASRPELPAAIATEAASATDKSLAVFVCGPSSMQKDVANAIAAEQLQIMKNGVGDIYLHMEHFSWA